MVASLCLLFSVRLDGSQPLPARTPWEMWELPGTGHKKHSEVRVEYMVCRTLCPIEGVVEEEAREHTSQFVLFKSSRKYEARSFIINK